MIKSFTTLSALGLFIALVNCSADPLPCEDTKTCASAGGDAGGDTGVPTCDPAKDASCITNSGGVFVSANAQAGGDGTKEHPLSKIADGIARADGNRNTIFIAEGDYAENISITKAVNLVGGLSSTWAPGAGKAKIVPPKGVAVMVSGGVTVAIYDIAVNASADPTIKGASAIGIFAASSTLDIRRVESTSGDGVGGEQGALGETRPNYTKAPDPGGSADGATSGKGKTCTCVDGTSSKGGNGAAGNGADVSAGEANPATGTANSGPSNLTACGDGTVGQAGAAGAEGDPSKPGALTEAGWSSTTQPVIAPNGRPGQGGGGGGAKTQSGTNAGGGGGCGGCGGAGGSSGGNGGSSFALLSFKSTITVDGGAFKAGAGGTGGIGGEGQSGQKGGAIGTGACNGGPGGDGAGGSGGGGGVGGHSAAIAFVGTAPTVSGATLTAGTKGAGGSGGNGGSASSVVGAKGKPGTDGRAENTLSLE